MKIVLLGAGNVGVHLGKHLFHLGYTIPVVYSRNIATANALALQINALAVNTLDAIPTNADLYLLAVADNAILKLANALAMRGINRGLVVHTSGGTPTEPLGAFFHNFGSFYPLQSFSKEKIPDWSSIPICIHANTTAGIQLLEQIAQKCSPHVHLINDEQRAALHVAAVFVNNFTNHLYHIGETITKNYQVDFNLLKPLINETVVKIAQHTPRSMQTGPAKRNDTKTIEKHLNMLHNHPDWQHLYKILTQSIQDLYA